MHRKTSLAFAFLLAVPAAALAQDTDIWLGNLDLSGGRVAITELVNITKRPGYDNQPAFFPDQRTLAYTVEAETGTHAVLYDLTTGKARPLPSARGYSPTPTEDGKQFMTTVHGYVALRDLDGSQIRALTDSVSVGYYTPVDAHTFVLFINEPARRIVIYDVDRRTMETMAEGAITPLYKVTGENAYTFVAVTPFSADSAVAARIDPATLRLELRKLDLDRRRVQTLAVIPFETAGQHFWTPRHTLLMGSGNRILEWDPAAPDTWKPVASFDDPGLQGISRIVISPRGDRIAIVSVAKE